MFSYSDRIDAEFGSLVGKTLARVDPVDDVELRFILVDGSEYRMFHDQDCCETVRLEEIVGELADLVGSPILVAEERTSKDGPLCESEESFTWTFYELATNKGSVTLRWYGSSNGYYSESVDFCRVKDDRDQA